MFKLGDKVVVKDLDVLIKDNDLIQDPNFEEVYCNKDKDFIIFKDFAFFNNSATIDQIDDNDPNIPYFLSLGIWVPEFMIKLKEEPKKEIKVANEIQLAKAPNEKVWINNYTQKPFGKLFIKLINIDPKIAEFSNTAFSKLKKHELQYIAKLLQDHGHKVVDYNKLTQKELASYCYLEVINM